MSTRLAQTRKAIRDALSELSAAVKRQADQGKSALKMSVPAQPHDSDLVIGDALRSAFDALTEIKTLKGENERLKQERYSGVSKPEARA